MLTKCILIKNHSCRVPSNKIQVTVAIANKPHQLAVMSWTCLPYLKLDYKVPHSLNISKEKIFADFEVFDLP